LSSGQWERALTVLTRAAITHPPLDVRIVNLIRANTGTAGPVAVRVAIETQRPTPLVTALTEVSAMANIDALRRLYHAIPPETLMFGDFAVDLATTLVSHDRNATSEGDDAQLATEGTLRPPRRRRSA
jgi:hypothetical protein